MMQIGSGPKVNKQIKFQVQESKLISFITKMSTLTKPTQTDANRDPGSSHLPERRITEIEVR